MTEKLACLVFDVRQALDLGGLARALNALQDYADEHDANREAASFVDTTHLPAFGGPEPRRTEGIFSWDSRSFLRSDRRWFVEDRDDLEDLAAA